MALVCLDAALAPDIPYLQVGVQASAGEEIAVGMELDGDAGGAMAKEGADDLRLLEVPKLHCAALVASYNHLQITASECSDFPENCRMAQSISASTSCYNNISHFFLRVEGHTLHAAGVARQPQYGLRLANGPHIDLPVFSACCDNLI